MSSKPRTPARIDPALIAVGPGPRWFRRALIGVACVYFAALIHHPPDTAWLRPVAFFTESTCLFPRASSFAIEYRLEAWACTQRWVALDPRPYFPIQPDDKESRLQRLGYFFDHTREVMRALEAYITEGHTTGVFDGVSGAIGGIRLVKVVRPFPAAGEPVDRYHYEPLAPIPAEQRRDMYYTPAGERKRRCEP